MRGWIVLSAGIIVALSTLPVAANSYTEIQPPSGSELGHAAILSDVYGGTFTADGVNFSNENGITAYRVWDTDGGQETIHLLKGDQNGIDQIWTDGTARLTATAKYAAFNQSFGWNGGGYDGDTYIELLNDQVLSRTFKVGGDFLFGVQPNDYQWWSKNSLNGDADDDGFDDDHLATYYIVDPFSSDPAKVWMLFWEDLPASRWDQDYNDWVIEIRAVPEPATLLLLGIGTLGLFRRKRNR